jgi:hypothetical protein
MSRMHRSRGWVAGLLAAGILGAAVAGSAYAVDIYKWVDENGVTHYSNIKPSGVKWQLLQENKVSVIPGSRIGAEADRAAERERASAARSGSDEAAQQEQIREQGRAQRREKRLQECERNNGVDCEREVDTELRAEDMQRGVIRTVPPGVKVSPVPTTSTAPVAQGSTVR